MAPYLFISSLNQLVTGINESSSLRTFVWYIVFYFLLSNGEVTKVKILIPCVLGSAGYNFCGTTAMCTTIMSDV